MARAKKKTIYDEEFAARHSSDPEAYGRWLDKERKYRRMQNLKKKIKSFLVLIAVNVALAAPIGFITFYAVSHTLAQTPFGVKYKGDPDLYAPYDARELVSGEITAIEKSTIKTNAPVYGAGLAMIVAAFLSLIIFLGPGDDDDNEILIPTSLILASLCASFAASIGSMIIMDPFYVQTGINANWTQPLFVQFSLAIIFSAAATFLGVIVFGVLGEVKEKLSDLRDYLSEIDYEETIVDFKDKVAEYFAR